MSQMAGVEIVLADVIYSLVWSLSIDRVAGEIIRLVASVCVCVCVSVRTFVCGHSPV